jgi:glyceraldehyde-3-phosphate dehydrogenase (NADP+)
MKKEYGIFIDGAWRKTGQSADVVYPFTGKPVAKVSLASPKDVEEATKAAVRAFEETRRLPSHKRSAVCHSVSHQISERRAELAKTMVLETGKPLKQCLAEVDRASSTFAIAAEEANRVGGEYMPLDVTAAAEGHVGIWKRVPVGPVAGITPFNFPLNLVAHKVAPAIASGCTIVLKPASKTPISALLLAEMCHKAGALPGQVNVLPMPPQAAKPLVEDERFKLVTFTGSASVGWDIKNRAGKKRVVLELGGNAGTIVHSDADLDLAVKKIVGAAFYYSGQNCIRVQRVYVQKEAYNAFREKFLAAVKALKFGDPMRSDTDIGTMVDEENANRINEWVAEAAGMGASILLGGKRKGAAYPPTVLENVSKKSRAHKEESFGPVVNLYKYEKFEDAVREVNDTRYGLQAGVFTRDIRNALLAFKELQVGGVEINETSTFRVDNMPYGGVKDSGFGREGVRFGVMDMTEIRLLVINDV